MHSSSSNGSSGKGSSGGSVVVVVAHVYAQSCCCGAYLCTTADFDHLDFDSQQKLISWFWQTLSNLQLQVKNFPSEWDDDKLLSIFSNPAVLTQRIHVRERQEISSCALCNFSLNKVSSARLPPTPCVRTGAGARSGREGRQLRAPGSRSHIKSCHEDAKGRAFAFVAFEDVEAADASSALHRLPPPM